jgi:peptide/nickel transport system substrate-binding protein
MHENTYLASGQDAVNTGNFAHFKDNRATRALDQWKGTLDVKKQKRLATQVQKLWLEKLPVIPIFIGPQWSTYSTKYFHCFPTPRNHYSRPIYNTYPDNSLLLTTICPGGRAENGQFQYR